MKKRRSNILKDSFFERGGISRNVFFILFVVLLMIFQIGISFKSEDTIIKLKKVNQDLFDENMKLISVEINLMNWYKPSVIQSRVISDSLFSLDYFSEDPLPTYITK